MELVLLQEKIHKSSLELRLALEEINEVRARTEVIVLDNKNADDPSLPKLRNKIRRALKVCNTKMIVIDDAASRQSALLNHMVSQIHSVDSGKGLETNNNNKEEKNGQSS